MFGDIVSDCAPVCRRTGFAPSANSATTALIFDRRTVPPKYSGHEVNHRHHFNSKSMLTGSRDMATRLESAIARVIAEGKVRTYDMGGKDSTLDVAKAIADYAS
jgi:3-isopropylmalate dehydrogenase